jgi:hypothetical protein
MNTSVRATMTALLVAGSLAGCSGVTDPGVATSGEPEAGGGGTSDQAGPGGQGPGGMDQLGLTLVDGLIPELSAVPVPDGAGFVTGTAYTAAQDPRQTAVQDVYVAGSVADAAAFYQAALPGAGFQVTDTEQGQQSIISFVDPDGYEGELIISPSAIGPPTQIHIQIHRYKTVDELLSGGAGSAVPEDQPPATVAVGHVVLVVDGTSHEFSGGSGDCAVSPSAIGVTLQFDTGFAIVVGAPSAATMQVQVSESEIWTPENNVPARFDVQGSRATWSGTLTNLISGSSAVGSLTIEC